MAAMTMMMRQFRRALSTDVEARFPKPSITAAPMPCGRGDKKTKKEKMIERLKDKIEVPMSTPWPLPFKLI